MVPKIASTIPITFRPRATGEWWALNRKDKGFASFGYRFEFLGDALDAFGAKLQSFGRDEYGLYILGKKVAS